MAADFSRVRMDALADLTGVELKQGGVLLDADFNEGVAIVDRRLRALASDVLGRATYSQTTPDAFLLTPAGSGFTIGRGRMYVDGLLAENHGLADPAQREFDPLLAETRYTQQPAYAQQPWLQPPPALPTTGRHLCYLDVWERELTHLEQPALVEPAVGVETSSRRQIVWQVRVLADEAPASVTCASPDADIPGWAALIAPSTGRLSTGTFDVAGVPDPCELPPSGGYTGLENQLYRVEIHDPGQPGGTATFKWSRDNGCIASRVAAVVAPGELELQSLGRDDVQRFRIGDWVEVLSDARELAQTTGVMRRIADIDEALRRIRFAPDLAAGLLTEPGLRVRRWDQAGKVWRTGPAGSVVEVQDLDAPAATGLVAVPAATTTLLLENGVTVRFSSVGAKGFKAGDWWVFAARTADASVQILDAEPPRGVHHHFARLGFWDIAAGTLSDCRGRWPPAGGHDCSCTACVTPESHADGSFTIQDAIDQVRQAGGGTVCLAIGPYALRSPLDLANVVSLRLRGQGPGTVLVAAGSALAIRDALGVAVEQMTVIAAGAGSAITARGVLGLALTDLVVAVLAANVDLPPAAIALSGAVAGARIARSLLLAPDGVRALEGRDDNAANFLLTAALTIEDNLLWCTRSAVSLAGPVLHLLATRVERNQVLGCRQTALVLTGFGAPNSAMRIAANHVQVPAGGVACGSDGCWIGDNKLVATDATLPSIGIELRAGLDPTGADQAQLLANQIAGCTTAAILVASPVRQLICKLNIVERCANGLLMGEDAEGGAVAIENNQFDDIGPQASTDAATLTVGILLSRVEAATVAGNALSRVGTRAIGGGIRAALMAFGVVRLRAQGNRITALAPPGDFGGLAAGVLSSGAYTQLDLLHNEIDRDVDPASQPRSGAPWAAVYVTGGTAAANVTGAPNNFAAGPAVNTATTTAGFAQRFGTRRVLPVDGGSSVVFDGNRAFVAAAAARADGGAAAVLGNVFAAASALPLVLLQAERECLFSDNRCEHVGSSGGFAAVMLATQVAILSANRVRNNTDVAIDVFGARTVAAVANITTGTIRTPGGLPAAMQPLNLRA